MPNIRANDIQIEYDTFGDPGAPPILLIMGLGAQMIWWDADFCRMLADRDLFVIRFDNRDVGLSTKITENPGMKIAKAFAALLQGEPIHAPYSLNDMADDAFGLLDALDIDRAHVCGASMGGMIAQTMAIQRPKRLRTLTSIMSHTGNPGLPQPTQMAQTTLITPPPIGREAYIEYGVNAWRILRSPGYPFDENRIRLKVAESYDRCFHPEGFGRQFLAILVSENRRPALTQLKIPTLVIHGVDDPLVPVAGGKDTAEAVPGAKLLIIEGMGHDFPPELWPRIVEAIASHTRDN